MTYHPHHFQDEGEGFAALSQCVNVRPAAPGDPPAHTEYSFPRAIPYPTRRGD